MATDDGRRGGDDESAARENGGCHRAGLDLQNRLPLLLSELNTEPIADSSGHGQIISSSERAQSDLCVSMIDFANIKPSVDRPQTDSDPRFKETVAREYLNCEDRCIQMAGILIKKTLGKYKARIT